MKPRYNIGFTASCFDLLHSGHITMLQEAKSICDHLIVGLHIDPSFERAEKNKPIQTLMERQIQLNAVKYVDEIVVYNTEADLVDILLSLPIDVRIIGEEYREKEFTGKELPIEIVYNSRKHSFSSTTLRNRVKEET